jgi:hypothetical protein
VKTTKEIDDDDIDSQMLEEEDESAMERNDVLCRAVIRPDILITYVRKFTHHPCYANVMLCHVMNVTVRKSFLKYIIS